MGIKQGQLLSIQILPNAEIPSFFQRESGITHTSYREEVALLSLIQQGNTALVKKIFEQASLPEIVIGRLSDDSLRQMKYWAVCCVTLVTRYAIQGGLDEMTAFNLSDHYILHIDSLNSVEDIVNCLGNGAVEITELVRKSAHGSCPAKIRKCLHYIDKNLHTNIRLAELAELTGLSSDHLSKSFKKHLGKSVHEYVTEKKLEEAKRMLREEYDQKFIAYQLGFCSQTYFISCFKKAYGITPNKYAQLK